MFFVFERFHLNYAYTFANELDEEYAELEACLQNLNAMTVLCTISEGEVENRLRHRAAYTGDIITEQAVKEYIENQKKFIETAKKSKVKTMILNTDIRDWEGYAKNILQAIAY